MLNTAVPNSSLPNSVANPAKLTLLFVILALFWMPVLFGASRVVENAGLFQLAEMPNPYFVAAHAATLYFWSPLVVLSACVLFLSPGLLLSIGFNASHGFERWMLCSIALSILALSTITGAIQSILGAPLLGWSFAILVIVCSLIAFLFSMIRIRKGAPIAWPFQERFSNFTLITCIAISFGVVVVLTPKFFWDNLNGDGAHAYESARLLLRQPLPFWGPSAGPMSSYPGLTSMLFAYPASWFMRLFGEFEASVRLPMVLYVVAIFCGVSALAQENQARLLGRVERLLIWLAVLTYTMVVVFNATYNPYSADIALPPARETLMVASFLGFLLSFIRKERTWMTLFAGLTFFSLPTGLFFIALWLFAVFVAWRPRPWSTLLFAGFALTAFVVLDFALPSVLKALDFPPPGKEFSAEGIATRLGFGIKEWKRLLFLFLPAGVLPAFSLFLWSRQDHISRSIAVTTVVCFLFFFFQTNTALHHFIPTMVFPLIVFWRMYLSNVSKRFVFLSITAVAVIFSFVISFPQNHAPHTAARMIGATIEDRTGGYTNSDPRGFERAMIFRHLFPLTWSPVVPKKSYGGSPLVWYFYAHRAKPPGQSINYVLQFSTDPPPYGMTLVAEEFGSSLYVRSKSEWTSHRKIRPPTPAGSKVYTLPHNTLYKRVSREWE